VEDFINSEWLLDREDDGGARYIPPSMRRLDVAALLLTVPQFRAAPERNPDLAPAKSGFIGASAAGRFEHT
jgi:hypothetical protein